MRFALMVPILAVTACVPEGETPGADGPDRAECGADALQQFVGDPVDAHDFAADRRPLRILPPGSAMTMDHRIERLNIDLDEEGVITRIWCG